MTLYPLLYPFARHADDDSAYADWRQFEIDNPAEAAAIRERRRIGKYATERQIIVKEEGK